MEEANNNLIEGEDLVNKFAPEGKKFDNNKLNETSLPES